MKYYKVKPEADNKYNKDRTRFFIGGELLTEKEKAKYCCPDAFVDPEDREMIEQEMGVGA